MSDGVPKASNEGKKTPRGRMRLRIEGGISQVSCVPRPLGAARGDGLLARRPVLAATNTAVVRPATSTPAPAPPVVALLGGDVAALELERLRQGRRLEHAREVLGAEGLEDVREQLGPDDGPRVRAKRPVQHDEDELEPVTPRGAARDVWEAEEAALVAVLVEAHEWRRHQAAHEPLLPCVVVGHPRHLLLAALAPDGAVNHVRRQPQLPADLLPRQPWRVDLELQDRRRVDDAPVPVPKPTGPCPRRLLPDGEVIPRAVPPGQIRWPLCGWFRG